MIIAILFFVFFFLLVLFLETDHLSFSDKPKKNWEEIKKDIKEHNQKKVGFFG